MANSLLTRDVLDTLLKNQPKSTTTTLNSADIEQYQELFRKALCIQDPAVRQIFLALSGKIIKRVTDSLRVVLRDKKLYTDYDRQNITKRYQSFIAWIIDFCFDSLYCNAYFGCYTLIMSVIKLVIKHVPSTIEGTEVFQINHLLSRKQCYDSILSCLNDSFEENKALALELLFLLPNNKDIINNDNLKLFEEIAYQLVASVNPAHSLTCQYVFKLCIEIEARQTGQHRNNLLLAKLNSLSDLVEEGVKQSQENFVVALKHNAIYPKLTCIRALLADIDMSQIEQDRDQWRCLAKRIVVSSINACKAVSTIVCNLNPETIGHLPMDQKPIDAETLSRLLKIQPENSDVDVNTITSQLLLISGWKTIKECSLSLGTLCTRLWWPDGGLPGRLQQFPGLKSCKSILDTEDIVEIIQFFEHYLKNLRHRGAFEQAYSGFIMVTRRIWNDEQFKTMLVLTLKQILNDFRDDAIDNQKAEYLKAYVTRRSAGLPFIVQAILISEKPQETETLDLVMNCLYEILESENSETYQKIHCLNILNGLTKEANLGEKMMRYVGKTFAITLDSLASDSFPIRNCANMLLKATVDRTFGTNRSKHSIHKKNLMTFGKFFLDCPSLQEKMVEHLKRGSGKTDVSFAAIHGVFIILSRLRANQVYSDLFKPNEELIGPFIEPLLKLANECEDIKITEIAMQLVARLDRILSTQNNLIVQEENLLRPWANLKNNQSGLLRQVLFQKNILYELYQSKTELDDDFTDESDKKIMLERIAKYQSTFDFDMDYRYSFFLINQILDLFKKCIILSTDDKVLYEKVTKFAFAVIKPFAAPRESHEKPYLERAISDPLFEECIFKSIILLAKDNIPPYLIEFITLNIVDINKKGGALEKSQNNEILLASTPAYSDSLQGALLRFIRQRLHKAKSNEPVFLEKLMTKLDIDSTATFCTPSDRIENPRDSAQERQQLRQFYGSNYSPEECQSIMYQLYNLTCLIDLKSFKEFQRSPDSDKFSPKFSNTSRGIELIALLYCLNKHSLSIDKKVLNQLGFNNACIEVNMKLLCDMLRDLPDCDIKCLVIVYCGFMLESICSEEETRLCRISSDIADLMVGMSHLLDMHSDGNHSNVIRETICNCLKGCAMPLAQWKSRDKQVSFISNVYSAIIKLSQDDDSDIRNACHSLIRELVCYSVEKSQTIGVKNICLEDGIYSSENLLPTNESEPKRTVRNEDHQKSHPLESLIYVVTNYLLKHPEGNSCFQLLMKVIFNHSKSYSISATLDKEGLFDKTKLNTFADHVATTCAVLEQLRNFFGPDKRIVLNELEISADILAEFQIDLETGPRNSAGDYGWRKKVSTTTNMNDKESRDYVIDNNDLVVSFIQQILASLDYFSNGYKNMLTDTGYTHHELSLYKRLAFIAFVRDCTLHNVKNMDLLDDIRKKLETILKESCATTLLVKTLDMIK